MEIVTLSSKGQLVLPKNIRDKNAWPAGTQFTVESTKDGVLLRPVPALKTTTIDQVAGCLARPGQKRISIEDMDRAIEEAIRERHARGRY